MNEAPDKSAQLIRFLIAILGIALAIFAWLADSSRASSLSQKMSRFTLSRLIRSS